MAVEAIQQVTELERTVKQEKEAAAAESKQRILEAQRSARRQVEESRQNAEAETRQMMAEAEQEAAKWTASVLEQARLDCEEKKQEARGRLEQAVAFLVDKVVKS